MFDNLTNKIESAFAYFNKITRLDEKQADEGLRKIRQALLESDVALSVTKKFIENVKPKIIGKEVLKSVTPGQMIVKIVYDELTKTLGDKAKDLLEVLATNNKMKSLPFVEGQPPIEIAKRAKNATSISGEEVIIFDTAGRTQIDQQMMMELKMLYNEINPQEIMLVADSLTGQDAVNIASEFNKLINLTSITLTRLDADGKGGAALSMKSVTGCPIKFLATGEKIDQLEVFHPDRIANRILGMGDVVSLVEKVSEDLEQKKIKDLEDDLKKGTFTLNAYLQQIQQMKKAGGMTGVLSMLPGVSKMKKQIDDSGIDNEILKSQESIILSMTGDERDDPKLINGSRKKRIASGSGTDISLVNKLLNQHKMMSNMMKKMSKGGNTELSNLKGIPPELLNNLK